VQWSRVEIRPFDEKERMTLCLAQPSDLWPKRPVDHRQMQIAHAFPFDDRRARDVVADCQLAQGGRYLESVQGIEQTTLPLPRIDNQRCLHIYESHSDVSACLVAVPAWSA